MTGHILAHGGEGTLALQVISFFIALPFVIVGLAIALLKSVDLLDPERRAAMKSPKPQSQDSRESRAKPEDLAKTHASQREMAPPTSPPPPSPPNQ